MTEHATADMLFDFQYRPAESAWVETIWHTQGEGGGTFMSSASSQLELVVTKQRGGITFSLRGPETQARPAPIPKDAEFLGIILKHGTFMPTLPMKNLLDGGIHLPGANSQSFWLHGAAWQFPTFENADTFISRLVRDGLLVHDNVVADALHNCPPPLSPRSVERRFVQATGLTQGTVRQIERARQAWTLLQQGVSIFDTIEIAGYYDQPHLTRALKRLIGRTPAQILKLRDTD